MPRFCMAVPNRHRPPAMGNATRANHALMAALGHDLSAAAIRIWLRACGHAPVSPQRDGFRKSSTHPTAASTSRRPKHPPENRIDVLEVIGEVELLFDLGIG